MKKRNSESCKSDLEEEAVGDNVVYANSIPDPLTLADDSRSFACKDGSVATIKYFTSSNLSKDLLKWTLDLFERNMRSMYIQSSWGWKPKEKKEEMTEAEAKFLIAFINDNPVAFSHFRFDMDYGHEVTYCYEIQLEPHARSLGLGKHIMGLLDTFTVRLNLSKVILTVFKFNLDALAFFNRMGFELDESSPTEEQRQSYFIMSKTTASIVGNENKFVNES